MEVDRRVEESGDDDRRVGSTRHRVKWQPIRRRRPRSGSFVLSWRLVTLTADLARSWRLTQDDPATEVAELRQSANSAWETFVEALPRAGIALAVLAGFFVVGRLLRPVVRRRLARSRTPSFSRVFARLTSATMTLLGFLTAVAIVFPSVRPVDLLAGAGVLSVAAGFAFQDILQNLLAGLLLLFRQPFRGGDQIEVGDVAGTVEEINIRETVIVTFEGRRVLIPNAKVYSDVITVQTARRLIRANFVVGVAYETDIDTARQVALEAVRAVDGVASEPPPEVLGMQLATSSVELDVQFWCASHQLEMRRTLSGAVQAVKEAFAANDIEIPTDIVALQATRSLAAVLDGRRGMAGERTSDDEAARR
jgi:small conductance mechanosensitive channel